LVVENRANDLVLVVLHGGVVLEAVFTLPVATAGTCWSKRIVRTFKLIDLAAKCSTDSRCHLPTISSKRSKAKHLRRSVAVESVGLATLCG